MLKKTKLFYLLLIVAFLVTACGTKDLTKDKSAREIVEGTYQKSAEIQNYDMNLEMQMKMTIPGEEPIDMNITGTATFFQNPMKMKMVMEMPNPENGETMEMVQYMEATETGMIIYQNVQDQWFKMSIEDPAMNEIMNMDPKQNIELFMKHLKEANILADNEKVGEKDAVKIELVASSEIYNEIINQMPGMELTPADLPLGPEIFGKMGDIKYIIWVDKTTLDVIKTSMDLTDNIRNIGEALVESGDFPPEMAEIFKGMEMSATYEMLNINAAEPFEIPEEAKNAEELLMP
jgi:hypothetical protein